MRASLQDNIPLQDGGYSQNWISLIMFHGTFVILELQTGMCFLENHKAQFLNFTKVQGYPPISPLGTIKTKPMCLLQLWCEQVQETALSLRLKAVRVHTN
jgi:hypothetical protein